MPAKLAAPALLSDPRASRAHMVRLIRDCTHYSFAVAWAGNQHAVFDAIVEHRRKIRRGVIGTHRMCTSPDALRAFESFKVVRMREPDGALFHPKVYLFEFPDRAVVVVGSHNLTQSAYQRNIEASFALTLAAGSDTVNEVRELIETAWRNSSTITPDLVHAYAVMCAAQPPRPPRSMKLPALRAPQRGEGRLLRMTWGGYLDALLAEEEHTIGSRMKILDLADDIASFMAQFHRAEEGDMRLFAGTVGPKEVTKDWGYFGRMSGFGVMKNLVNEHPLRFVDALLEVPRRGEVREEHYRAFQQGFERAFQGAPRKGGVAGASRLLALWRPDTFVPFNKANKRGLAPDLGIRAGSVELDSYWEQVVLTVKGTAWWRAPRPRQRLAAQAWEYRAALVDTLHYHP